MEERAANIDVPAAARVQQTEGDCVREQPGGRDPKHQDGVDRHWLEEALHRFRHDPEHQHDERRTVEEGRKNLCATVAEVPPLIRRAARDQMRAGGEPERGRGAEDVRRFEASAGGELELALVVLVNAGSASAAEVVAGALQDRRRALIAGEPTYGKGSAQSVFELPGGAGMRLTTARFETPAGRAIEGVGITPDLPLAAQAVGADGALPSVDPQLARALEVLANPVPFEALRAAQPPAARAE